MAAILPETRLRMAVIDDLESIVDITIAAEYDTPFYAFNYPHFVEYPEDNAFHWRLLVRHGFYDNKAILLVGEIEHEGRQIPLGWCKWEWKGSVPAPSPPFQDSPEKTWQRQANDEATAKIRATWKRRDYDPDHFKIWIDTKNEIDRKFWRSRERGLLYLSALYVQPQFQGQGVGTLMKDWGFKLAEQQGVEMGVLAGFTPSVEIYKHWGFQECEIIRMQQEGQTEYVDLTVLSHTAWSK